MGPLWRFDWRKVRSGFGVDRNSESLAEVASAAHEERLHSRHGFWWVPGPSVAWLGHGWGIG